MIRPEAALIKILLEIDVYNKYCSFIDIQEDRELKLLYSFLDKVMERYQRDVTFDEYCVVVLGSITTDKPVIAKILDVIRDAEVNKEVAEQLLIQAKERAQAHNLALLAIAVTEGKKTLADLQEALATHEPAKQEISDDKFVSDDLEELYEGFVQKQGLRWRLHSLNRILGSLRRGNFGFIFARPETGKTTFLASEATFFAEQVAEGDGPILWFNNEEEGQQVQIRCYQGALGVSRDELFIDVKDSKLRYQSLIKGKLRIYDSASISKAQVERICREVNPSCIIFDQLDKIKGFDGDRDDLRLGTIYQWARELAKTYCPVIGVCQADGSAEGKKWLTMENVANAKTAKQAEADWILGIGATHQEGFEYIRHLHASKNKLPGDLDTETEMRHGKVDVIIEPQIARYKDYS